MIHISAGTQRADEQQPGGTVSIDNTRPPTQIKLAIPGRTHIGSPVPAAVEAVEVYLLNEAVL
jgi:hypothetical protein